MPRRTWETVVDNIIADTITKLMVEAERRFAFCQLNSDGRAYTAGEAVSNTLDEACGGKSNFLYARTLVEQLHGHLFSGSGRQDFSKRHEIRMAAYAIIDELVTQLKSRIDRYDEIVAFRMKQAHEQQFHPRSDPGWSA